MEWHFDYHMSLVGTGEDTNVSGFLHFVDKKIKSFSERQPTPTTTKRTRSQRTQEKKIT